MKVFAAAAIVVIGMVGATIGGYVLAVRALNTSQHALCPIVRLVTAKPIPPPVDPAKNPSQVASYEFYEDFVKVRNQYHC